MIALQKISIRLLLVFAIVAVSIMSLRAEAQRKAGSTKAASAKKRDTGQKALVIVDGSAIYQAASFDSPVVEYLDRGKQVVISQKLYRGLGGLGAFYKIRLRPRVYGYITDVDVELQGKIVNSNGASKSQPTEPRPQDDAIPGDPTQLQEDIMDNNFTDEPQGDGIYYKRYTGLTYQSLNYTEKISNQKKSAATGFLGFKMSGPGKLMGGAPLDIEVLLGVSAPSFYDEVADSTSGFMLIGHMMPMFPLIEKPRYVVYYSFGPMLRYENFKVKIKDKPSTPEVDSQELALGLNVGAGAAFLIAPKYVVRFDTRYTYENESYIGFGAAVQYQY